MSGRTRNWLKVKTKAGKAEMEKRGEAWHGSSQGSLGTPTE
jgi:hypothetical protein